MTRQAVQDQQRILGGDLDLVQGGKLAVTMGVSRRVALVEVTAVDVLADDYPYPACDPPVHSIRDDLATVFVTTDTVGPNLLQNCMVIAGRGRLRQNQRSAMSPPRLSHDGRRDPLGVGTHRRWAVGGVDGPVAARRRCHPADRTRRAWDGQEPPAMTRAALRIGYTRKPGYRQATPDADDDKVPVSLLAERIWAVRHPEARENLRLVTCAPPPRDLPARHRRCRAVSSCSARSGPS